MALQIETVLLTTWCFVCWFFVAVVICLIGDERNLPDVKNNDQVLTFADLHSENNKARIGLWNNNKVAGLLVNWSKQKFSSCNDSSSTWLLLS